MLLCFTMGLQNAMITKISGAVIRTTHLTGMLTNIGIELGHITFTMTEQERALFTRDKQKLRLLSSLVLLFFTGRPIGAMGFKRIGFLFTLPLATIPLGLAVTPISMTFARRRTMRPRNDLITACWDELERTNPGPTHERSGDKR
jgi:uncharacterized membrane protein YoaK (UPF0700 family)